MKIVFMGTPDFAVPSLKKLSEHHEIVGVVTATDKPAGRGKKLHQSAVKKAALDLSLPVLQPVNLKDGEFQSKLSNLEAQLFVVVAFRMLPVSIWSMPPKGTINLHGSLLPDYRGAAPINRAIMNGDERTGLTTFFINENIDTGPLIDSLYCRIGENETAGELHDKMMNLGAELLLNTVNSISDGTASSKEQLQSNEVKLAPKIFKDDCQIYWDQSAKAVHNHVRGLSPYPAAYSWVSGVNFDRMKIFKTLITDRPAGSNPGEVEFSKDKLFVQTKDFYLEIIELQVPGKKRATASSFLNGYHLDELFKFS